MRSLLSAQHPADRPLAAEMYHFIDIFPLSPLHFSHLNVGVLAVHHPDYFAPQFRLVEMIDGQSSLLGLSHLN